MRILVAWASKHGATGEIAAALADELRERGFAVDEREADLVGEVARYDAVVLGSGVYAGRWVGGAKRFVDRFRGQLAAMPIWLFSSGPIGDPPKPVEEPADAIELVHQLGAREHRVFAGRLDRDRLGFGERALVRMLHAPYGDFRDWDAIRAWADDIAQALPNGAPAGAR